MTTKVFNGQNYSSINENFESGKKTLNMDPYSKDEIEKCLDEVRNIRVSAMTPVITPIAITLDLSGSMSLVYDNVKTLFRYLADSLKNVPNTLRQYSLLITVIHKNEPKVFYLGDLRNFAEHFDGFIKNLPYPYGNTPLAKSLNMTDDIMKKLYATLEEKQLWYTIPIHFVITDNGENGSEDDMTEAKRRYSDDIKEGRKIFVEFMTSNNPTGLDISGYKVKIDEANSKTTIATFVDALKTASSAATIINDDTHVTDRPLKADRKAFNDYYSKIMLFNFRMCYERACKNEEED